MILYSALASEAAKLGQDLLDACAHARREWLEGRKEYTPVLWDALPSEDKAKALDDEKRLLDRYSEAWDKLIATAPSLLEIIYEREDYFEIRIRLESALDIADKPFQRINPNQLQCMESPLKQVERLMENIKPAPKKIEFSESDFTSNDTKPVRQTRKMLIARATLKGILPNGHAYFLDKDLYRALESRNWHWDSDSQRWIDVNPQIED